MACLTPFLKCNTGLLIDICLDAGACLACVECERAFHTLCIHPPALKPNDLPEGVWTCVSCGFQNKVLIC